MLSTTLGTYHTILKGQSDLDDAESRVVVYSIIFQVILHLELLYLFIFAHAAALFAINQPTA